METKRCAYCHKLQRADAHICSGCGHVFVRKQPRTFSKDLSYPSLPPASPHRAGHYSGLHPEDQPYQSSKIVARRPPVQEIERRGLPQHEPERIILPTVSGFDDDDQDVEDQVTMPASYVRAPADAWLPAYGRRKWFLSGRATSGILVLSCFCFLLASSLIAFTLIGRGTSIATAVITASPNILRANDTFTLSGRGFGSHDLMIFTYDANKKIDDGSGRPLMAHSDSQGAFSVQIHVPASWGIGDHDIHVTDEAQNLSVSTRITIQGSPATPPALQLATSRMSFAAAPPGAVSSKAVTLINAGGGQITWQASSDQIWLTVTPSSGVFAGRANVLVKVNRGDLAPKTYTGHIKFTQGGSARSVLLTVTMAVASGNPALDISSPALAFSATTAQDPAAQTIVLQNSGRQKLNWVGSVETGDGASWLAIAPARGQLAPGMSATITVNVQSLPLAVGSYQGAINFSGGADAQVTISLNVVAPGNLVASPPVLAFNAFTGQQPAARTLTLQNSGGMPVGWTAGIVTANHQQWLSVTPGSGQLAPGGQQNIVVSVDIITLTSGTHRGTITFTSAGSTQSLSVAVTFAVTNPPAPVIGLQPAQLSFATVKGTDPTAQSLTITDTGNATLDWIATEGRSGANLLTISPSHGSLPPGQSAQLVISPSVADADAGTLTTMITLADSDTGTTVASRNVPVTITVTDQAVITVSQNSLTFNNSSTYTSTSQLLVIGNAGSAELHWMVAPSSDAVSWLKLETSAGDVAPGGSTVVSVTCDSGSLAPGTYTATLLVSDSDAGTKVAPQTVQVTLVVGN
jgi:hypothetical protein